MLHLPNWMILPKCYHQNAKSPNFIKILVNRRSNEAKRNDLVIYSSQISFVSAFICLLKYFYNLTSIALIIYAIQGLNL